MTLYVTEDEHRRLTELHEKCKIRGRNSFDSEWWLTGLSEMFRPETIDEMRIWAGKNKGKKIKTEIVEEAGTMCRLTMEE